MLKVFFLYLIAGLIAFANGLSGPFMLDDHAFFTQQIKDVSRLGEHFIPKVYKSSVQENVPHGQPNFYYRPFAKILPSISYALFGQKTFFYHLINLTLLVTAGFLLFRFLLVTGILGRRGAFLAGLFYIIHPMNGVMVNYITASVFAAQVIWMVLSLLVLVSAVSRQQSSEKNRMTTESHRLTTRDFVVNSLWSLFFFLMALFCHETAVLLPFYALCLLSMYSPYNTAVQRWRKALIHTAPLWAVAIGWMVFRFFFASLGDGLLAKFVRFEMNPLEYAASVGKITAWYLSKLIVPWDIVLIWATPVVRGMEVLLWTGVLLILAVGLFLVLRKIKDKAFRIGILWLAAGFLPLPLMCLFQPTHGPMIEPHWFIFSSTGFFMCLSRLFEVFPINKFTTTTSGVAVVLVLFLLVAGWRHNHLWEDEKRYAHYWSEVSPSIKAVWFHLGEVYFRERRFSQAAGYYERSIRKTYQDYLAYQRMGLAFFNVQDFRRAQVNFMLSLELEGRQPGVRERLKWIERYAR